MYAASGSSFGLASLISGFQSISLIVIPVSESILTGVLVGPCAGQLAIELQVLAHRPAAGEQVVGPRQFVGTSGLPAVGRRLLLDWAAGAARHGPVGS